MFELVGESAISPYGEGMEAAPGARGDAEESGRMEVAEVAFPFVADVRAAEGEIEAEEEGLALRGREDVLLDQEGVEGDTV